MLRIESMGDDFIMGDKFLTDFSQAWKNVPDIDKTPEWYAEEWQKLQKKQTSTTVDIGEGDVHIVSSDGSERIYIHTNRGIAANLFVHGRIVHPEDMWECVPTRRLWMIAKATVPEFGGRPRRELRFSTSGWTYTEIAEVREHIQNIQAKHRSK
jgi:hypothetical protein